MKRKPFLNIVKQLLDAYNIRAARFSKGEDHVLGISEVISEVATLWGGDDYPAGVIEFRYHDDSLLLEVVLSDCPSPDNNESSTLQQRSYYRVYDGAVLLRQKIKTTYNIVALKEDFSEVEMKKQTPLPELVVRRAVVFNWYDIPSVLSSAVDQGAVANGDHRPVYKFSTYTLNAEQAEAGIRSLPSQVFLMLSGTMAGMEKYQSVEELVEALKFPVAFLNAHVDGGYDIIVDLPYSVANQAVATAVEQLELDVEIQEWTGNNMPGTCGSTPDRDALTSQPQPVYQVLPGVSVWKKMSLPDTFEGDNIVVLKNDLAFSVLLSEVLTLPYPENAAVNRLVTWLKTIVAEYSKRVLHVYIPAATLATRPYLVDLLDQIDGLVVHQYLREFGFDWNWVDVRQGLLTRQLYYRNEVQEIPLDALLPDENMITMSAGDAKITLLFDPATEMLTSATLTPPNAQPAEMKLEQLVIRTSNQVDIDEIARRYGYKAAAEA